MLKKLFLVVVVTALLIASGNIFILGAQQVPRFITLMTSGGVEIGSAATSWLTVRLTDGSSYLTLATDKTEDTAHTTADTGPAVMLRRIDVLASSADASGDYATFNSTSTGALWVAQPDPCSFGTKVYVSINQTTGTQLFTGTASNRTYVCSINLVTATAQNIALVAGTGSVCGTSTVGIMGGATAATGWNLAANGGLVSNGGNSAVAKSTVNADNICLLQSSSGQISGNIAYVVAP